VNVSGCFLIGVIATLADERALLSSPARLFLTVGILGGFTTFSTFGLESWRLVEAGELAGALANAAGSVAAGMLALVAGVWLARLATT
jgi:CrcB protein